jgi:hypothetical protein
VGQIGPDLHFTKAKPGRTKEGVTFFKEGLMFHAVLENPTGKDAASETELPRWKIDQASKLIWLNLSTAIRYVSDEKNRTSKLAVKQNAERTLTTLRKLQASYH